MKKIALLLLVAVAQLQAAEFGQVATSGAQLLKINFDARASGLGYAGASLVGGASAVYTNVAGTASVQNADVSFTYMPYFAGIKMMGAAGALNLEGIGVLSVHAAGFSTDEEITTIEQENGTGERYSISNTVIGVGFARPVMENLVIGVQAKYYSESYYGHAAHAIAFDVGSRYALGFANAHMALALQNFGPNVRPLEGTYTDYSDNNLTKNFNDSPLPVTFRVSLSAEPFTGEQYRVRFSADLVHPNDNVEHYNVGTEVILLDALALRGGVKINYDDESFAAGIGLDGSHILGSGIRIDYSYEKFKILPSVQKLTLGYSL
ncbi:MAG TPA: PorV/PorQ family protein [Bacteroidota bacterium]